MTVETSIREARPADLPVLRRLQRELREFDPAFLSYAVSGPMLVLVAPRGVGYLSALLDDEVYLAELAVEPACRRRGVGSALLEELHDRALRTGSEAVELVVHPENETALAFYERNGYRRAGRRKAFYDDADGIVMRRSL